MEDAERMHAHVNPRCVVCGAENPSGMQIHYTTEDEGVVAADWTPAAKWEGFKGIVHGGVLATVLDEAMSKAVVTLGLEALTGELRVRYRQYVKANEPLHIKGWVNSKRGRLIETEAQLLTTEGDERCHAWARFVVVPGSMDSARSSQ